jgi:hypothetical protein
MANQTQSGTQSVTQSFFSRSHGAVIRVFDEAGNIIETRRLWESGKMLRQYKRRPSALIEKRLFLVQKRDSPRIEAVITTDHTHVTGIDFCLEDWRG